MTTVCGAGGVWGSVEEVLIDQIYEFVVVEGSVAQLEFWLRRIARCPGVMCLLGFVAASRKGLRRLVGEGSRKGRGG